MAPGMGQGQGPTINKVILEPGMACLLPDCSDDLSLADPEGVAPWQDSWLAGRTPAAIPVFRTRSILH